VVAVAASFMMLANTELACAIRTHCPVARSK
jgi:hypothetical protein